VRLPTPTQKCHQGFAVLQRTSSLARQTGTRSSRKRAIVRERCAAGAMRAVSIPLTVRAGLDSSDRYRLLCKLSPVLDSRTGGGLDNTNTVRLGRGWLEPFDSGDVRRPACATLLNYSPDLSATLVVRSLVNNKPNTDNVWTI
jgi:hypothetical protein